MRYLYSIASFWLFAIFFSTSVFAQSPTLQPAITNYPLPYEGILPDNPLYPFKILRDRIVFFFTRDPLERVKLKLLFADKRLSMGNTLIKKQKYDLAGTTVSKGEKYMLEAIHDYRAIKKISCQVDPAMIDRLYNSAHAHEQLITQMAESIELQYRHGLGLSQQLAENAMGESKSIMDKRATLNCNL